MTEREFCFWLRDYICDRDVKALGEIQLKTIRDHLSRLVSAPLEKKEDPTPPSDGYTVYS